MGGGLRRWRWYSRRKSFKLTLGLSLTHSHPPIVLSLSLSSTTRIHAKAHSRPTDHRDTTKCGRESVQKFLSSCAEKNTEISWYIFFILFFSKDGFGTLRSVRSHVTEVSSVMTANVSDPPSSGGGGGGLRPTKQQFSPPAQPVSTLQHNYSNIQQPSPVLAAAISEPHLTRNGPTTSSQRPSGPNSLNGSPALVPNGNSASLGVLPGAQQGGAFSRSAVRPRTPTEEPRTQRRRERVTPGDDVKRSKLVGLHDLIHLEPPLNEDAVIRALQARFFNQKYYVSYFVRF